MIKPEEKTYIMIDSTQRKWTAEYIGDMIWMMHVEDLPHFAEMLDDTMLLVYFKKCEKLMDEAGTVYKRNGEWLENPKRKTLKLKKQKYAEDVNPKLFNAEYSLYKISQKIRTARKNAPDQAITLMFHGIPGTGKTHAVKYIADKLGMSYTNVVLSDVLGKYVGESEKAITKAFEDSGDGILHIDEFDSLAGNRDMADRNHEVSRVNAFLQAMDNYKGILIVTTNLIHKLDSAIKRRFMMKQEFKNLTKRQAKLAGKHFFPEHTFKFEEDEFYAPADFNIVKKSLVFEDAKDVTDEFLMKRLKEEALSRVGKVEKKDKAAFKMGFDLGGQR